MVKIVEVTGGQGGNSYLIVGEEKTALIDCGMAYCASKLITNIKQVINSRVLDYIIISHSHYDHIGAIPYLKEEWPMSSVLGADYAKRILSRENALKTIRRLSEQAAELFGDGELSNYDELKLRVDIVIGDDDVLDLGGTHIRVIETLGHTKCSLSFLVDQLTLFASESTGYMSKSGVLFPSFITSCADAIASIQICQELNPKFIISPHYGIVSEKDRPGYWRNCTRAIQETKAFILKLFDRDYSNEQILVEYERMFRDEETRLEQPTNAFRLNTEAMIKTVLKEESS